MPAPFPSRNELKCAGCSFIFAHLLLIGTISLFSMDYDVYNVSTEEDVIALHEALSSEQHRIETEISCALMWLSFPFLLMGLFGIKALIEAVYSETGGRMLVFVIINSYLIWISVVTILCPAINLTSVSFEWSFHEYTPEPDVIPTGYYMQLYTTTLLMELIDCIAIADATFLLMFFILPRFIVRDPKFKKLKASLDPDLPKCIQDWRGFMLCFNIVTISFAATCFVAFVIILFEFAKSGFFSPTGYAKFLVIWSVIIKLLMGLRMFHFATSSHYDKARAVFDSHRTLMQEKQDVEYKMEQIKPQKSDD